MKISRRHLLAGSLALAGTLGIWPEITSQRAYAASQQAYAAPANGAPIGQTIWLQTTNNHNYVTTNINQTTSPLQATATQVQAWE